MTRWTLDDVARMRLLSHRLVSPRAGRHGGAADDAGDSTTGDAAAGGTGTGGGSALGPIATPTDAVRHLACTQAQDLPGSTTSIALRTTGRSLTEVHAAYDGGEIVRSWPMRGTLFAVAAEDLGWMLSLTADPVLRSTVKRRDELGLTDEMLDRAEEVARAVVPATGLSRANLLEAWVEAGLPVEGGRGYHQIFHLAVSGVVCLGPIRETKGGATEQLFVIAAEWVGSRARRLDREEAIAEWFRRYVLSHGPVADKEFLWWTKLLRRDLAPVLDVATEGLAAITVDGSELWVDPEVLEKYGTSARGPGRRATAVPLLLPGFDEIVLGYGDRSAVMTDEQEKGQVVPGKNGVFRPTVTYRGRALGTWTRSRAKGAAGSTVDVTPFDGELPARVAKALPRLARQLPT